MFFFSPVLWWPTANGIEKCNRFLLLSEHHSSQGCPLCVNKTPLLCKRKVDHNAVAFGGLGLFLICALGDLSINLGGRKPPLTVQSFLLLCGSLLLSRFLLSLHLPFLEMCLPAVLLFLSSGVCPVWIVGSLMEFITLLFPKQFKNMIVVHLLLQAKHSKKKGNREEK